MSTRPDPRFAACRYSPGDISAAVWLYCSSPLRLRMIEEMLTAWGVLDNYERGRKWGMKFRREIAASLHRRSSRRGDNWCFDEAFLIIGGSFYYLWGVADRVGFVFDLLLQRRRRKRQRKRFTSARQVLRFLSVHDPNASLFYLGRDLRPVADCGTARAQTFETLGEVAGIRCAA